MSKARVLADLISDSQITASEITGLELNSIQEGDTVVEVSDTGSGGKVVVRVDGADNAEFNAGGIKVPSGTTAERDPAAVVGSLRYNTTTGFFETLTASGWGSVATPPSITGITPSNFNGEAGSTFTVDGAFFDTNTTAVFKGADGTEYAAATVTFVSSTQITVTNATNLPVANEPFKIRVTNGAGLSIESVTTIDAGTVPAFTTAAGNLASTTQWDEAVSVTVTATDAESTISGYAVTEGNLPAGLSLNATTGAITGTSTEQATTTYTFTISATDSAGNTNTRQFNIQIVNAAPVWSSPAEGGTESLGQDQAGSITLDATDPEGEAVSYTSGALPTGLSLSGNVISGTPTVKANTSVAVTASDGFASSVRNFFINVIVPPPQYNWSYSLETESFSYTGGFPNSSFNADNRQLQYYGYFSQGNYGNNSNIDRVWAFGHYQARTDAPLDPLTTDNLQSNAWESAWWGNGISSETQDGLLLDVGPAREVQFAYGNLNGTHADNGYLEIYYYDPTTSEFKGIGGFEIPASASNLTAVTSGNAYTSRYWYIKRNLTGDWSRMDYLETVF